LVSPCVENTIGLHITGSFFKKKVIINPAVSSRPEHAHLLSEGGFYVSNKEKNIQCGEKTNRNARITNSKLPEEFKFIPYKEAIHKKWEDVIAKSGKEDRELNPKK
jgi:hypothetical protein